MEQKQRRTNVSEFINELGAGAFKKKLAHALSDAALGTVIFGDGKKRGKVTLEFTFQQIGDNDQVIIHHKIANSIPTKRGKKAEEDLTESPMFVGKGGVLTVDQPREEHRGQFGLIPEKDGLSVVN